MVKNKGDGKQKNMILWFFQRISGLALLLVIGVHIWNLHYSHPDVHPTYENLVERLRTVGYIVLDISLLVLALFHGLNGVRNIVLDYTRKSKVITRWNIALGLVGIVFSLLGSMAVVKILTMG
ncbi:succinate dehydrogenase subunit D [Bacillus sp. OV194]|nr:succinate dehydrogenase subunit D [Bacillus sp. OV194]